MVLTTIVAIDGRVLSVAIEVFRFTAASAVTSSSTVFKDEAVVMGRFFISDSPPQLSALSPCQY